MILIIDICALLITWFNWQHFVRIFSWANDELSVESRR